MLTHSWIGLLSILVLAAPASMAAGLGLIMLAGTQPRELTVSRFGRVAFSTSTLAAISLVVVMAWSGIREDHFSLFTWWHTPGHQFDFTLQVDRLSVPFALISVAFCGVVASFAHRYMHREPGYSRFFLLLALFALGMSLLALAGNIDLAFAGWELVGLSSVLLVAFFHERVAPLENGLRVYIVYRICDIGLWTGAILLQHVAGTGEFGELFRDMPWPDGSAPESAAQATAIALLLVLAAAGKSAQIPFSGWLPRAMEGPTPSSAIFYGALSVHAGAFLLLRISPLLDRSPVASMTVAILGALTAIHATVTGRVQTDIKCALAYASMTQVGVIFVEIGAGLRWLPLAHLIGHACIRSLQFLRAPSLLHDMQEAKAAVGSHLPRSGLRLESLIPSRARRWLYRFALERCYLDVLLEAGLVRPFMFALARLENLDRRLALALAGLPATMEFAKSAGKVIPGIGREETVLPASPFGVKGVSK